MSDLDHDSATTVVMRHRDLLLNVLAKLAISEVTVHYEANENSGDISHMVVFPESQQLSLDTTTMLYPCLALVCDNENYRQSEKVKILPLRAALRDFALMWLSIKHPDWVHDEGSEGKVILDTDEHRCELIHIRYHMEPRHQPLRKRPLG